MGVIPTRMFPLGVGHGAPLPYDAEVGYLESAAGSAEDSAPYIDTLVTPGTKTRIEIGWMPTRIVGEPMHGIAGYREFVTNTNNTRCALGISISGPSVYWGVSNLNIANTVSWSAGNHLCQFIQYNGTTATYGYGGTTFSSTISNLAEDPGKSILIFARNAKKNNDTQPRVQIGANQTSRVYFVRIWQDYTTGVLSFDGIPVRSGSVGYLYDRVSGNLFGNLGVGAFGVGPDKFTGVNLVGSSVSNNAGILSGFTASSYATMPFYFTSGASSLEAVVKFKTPNVSTTQGIWGCVGSRNSFTPFYFEGSMAPAGLRSFVSSNGTSWAVNASSGGWTTSLSANTDTILRSKWNGTTLSFDILKNGAWTTERTLSVSGVFGASDLVPQLGTNRGTGWPFLGSIDLNYTYLMRDGALLWEGVAGAYKNVALLT